MSDSGEQAAAANVGSAGASIQRWAARIVIVTGLITAISGLVDALVALIEKTEPLACQLLPALPYCPKSFLRKGQTAGGTGGDDFDDSTINRDAAAIASLAIFSIAVTTADGPKAVIGKIRIQWADGHETAHGLKASGDEPILLSRGEVIRQIEIYDMTYSYPGANPPPTWVSGIVVTTNKRSAHFGNTNTSASTICVPDDKERIVGFYGKSGDLVDQLGCVFLVNK